MHPERDYKAVLSVSVPPEQRERFYASLAQFRQHAPFVTKSALVVEAVIAAAEQERQWLELLAHLPNPVQITRDGLGYTWHCASGQGAAATLLQAVQEALTALLGTPAAGPERVSMAGAGAGAAWPAPKGRTFRDETPYSDHEP